MIAERYSILHPSAAGMGFWLDVAKLDVLFSADHFEKLPPGWTPDPARSGDWTVSEGELVGRVGANLGPTILWFDEAIPGNHALYARVKIRPDQAGAATQPVAGEFIAYWNGDGRSAGPQPWSLVLGAINGWRGGYSGMEYLVSAGGPNYQSQGVIASQAFAVHEADTFELFAGRYNDVDFLFGAPVDTAGKTGPWVSIAQDILAAATPPPTCHLGGFKRVALGTAAFDARGVALHVERLAVYRVPASALSRWTRPNE